jgi:uncharacterized membrane protein YeiH
MNKERHLVLFLMTVSFFTLIDILGTFSFAAAGAFAAMKKKLDPFGVVIISFATAIGGGTIRDLLIGDLPVAWLHNDTAFWVILTGAVVTLFFGSSVRKFGRMLFLFDAMGLGLFTLIGLQKGIAVGLSTGICVMLGTITGCFGGVLRDVLLNNVPLIFQKEIYALASIIGGVFFFLLLSIGLDNEMSGTMAIMVVFFIRVLAVRFNLSLPLFYEKRPASS